jgi:hypothetical protein
MTISTDLVPSTPRSAGQPAHAPEHSAVQAPAQHPKPPPKQQSAPGQQPPAPVQPRPPPPGCRLGPPQTLALSCLTAHYRLVILVVGPPSQTSTVQVRAAALGSVCRAAACTASSLIKPHWTRCLSLLAVMFRYACLACRPLRPLHRPPPVRLCCRSPDSEGAAKCCLNCTWCSQLPSCCLSCCHRPVPPEPHKILSGLETEVYRI